MTRKILPYAIVVLFAYIGFSLPLPILPEMFLDPARSIVPGLSLKGKMIALGFMMASFPCGQFFGAPIIGHLSDIYGRKKIILYSLSGTTLGYLITAYCVSLRNFPGMFFGLVLCGFCEGNVTIGQSVVVDIAEHPEQKARHFGLLNAFISLGFIIGPLMGGQLANSSLVPWFTFATPFWTAAGMTILGILVIYFGSSETLRNKKKAGWDFLSSIIKGFKYPKMPRLYAANFFLALGYFSFFRFLPVFLKERFSFDPSYLSFVMVYGSLMMIVSVLWIVPCLAKRFLPDRILAAFAFFFALSVILCLLPASPFALWVTIPLTGVCLAVTITNGSLLISNAATLEFQGQALGTLTSIQVLAEAVTGFLGGLIAAELETLPLLIGAAMSCLCSIILIRNRIKYV
ncbi:MAG TPA: MFS transporter [Rhabdochlamydiaceae bacterium]|jgi:DHA1 family tetracycline resistance protein-like MFS transporter